MREPAVPYISEEKLLKVLKCRLELASMPKDGKFEPQ